MRYTVRVHPMFGSACRGHSSVHTRAPTFTGLGLPARQLQGLSWKLYHTCLPGHLPSWGHSCPSPSNTVPSHTLSSRTVRCRPLNVPPTHTHPYLATLQPAAPRSTPQPTPPQSPPVYPPPPAPPPPRQPCISQYSILCSCLPRSQLRPTSSRYSDTGTR